MTISIRNNKVSYLIRAVLFCLAFTVLFVVFSFFKGFFPGSQERLVHGIMGTVAALLTTYLFLRRDKKRFADIGLVIEKRTPVRFLVGMAAGLVIMGSLAMVSIYLMGAGIELNAQSNLGHFLLATSPLLPLAFMEELGFRAYPLQLLKEKLGIRPALLVTSILFALYHMANGWTVAASFLGPAVWGLVFGLAAIYSRGIAMPTGLHYAANLTTAALGATPGTGSIFIVREAADHAPVPGENWAAFLPSVALLVFAVICIEWYMRRKAVLHHHFLSEQ